MGANNYKTGLLLNPNHDAYFSIVYAVVKG